MDLTDGEMATANAPSLTHPSDKQVHFNKSQNMYSKFQALTFNQCFLDLAYSSRKQKEPSRRKMVLIRWTIS